MRTEYYGVGGTLKLKMADHLMRSNHFNEEYDGIIKFLIDQKTWLQQCFANWHFFEKLSESFAIQQ